MRDPAALSYSYPGVVMMEPHPYLHALAIGVELILLVGLVLFIGRTIWRKRAAIKAALDGWPLAAGRTSGRCGGCGQHSDDLDSEGECPSCFRRTW